MINMGDNAEIPYVVHETFDHQDFSEAGLPSYEKNPWEQYKEDPTQMAHKIFKESPEEKHRGNAWASFLYYKRLALGDQGFIVGSWGHNS